MISVRAIRSNETASPAIAGLAGAIAVFLLLVFASLSGPAVLPAMAQGIGERPPRAAEAVQALAGTEWQDYAQGISHLSAATALGTRITAFRVALDRYRLEVVRQPEGNGAWARQLAELSGAVLAVNGGFFASRGERLYPVGLLRDDGTDLSEPWDESGGYLALGKGEASDRVAVVASRHGLPQWAEEAIQSRPVMLENGGKWAMRSNDGNQERRTLFCINDPQMVTLVTITGGGLSLFEAGWILRGPKWGGFFDCGAAMALDGGSSTQLHVAGQPELSVDGLTRVDNVLAVVPR